MILDPPVEASEPLDPADRDVPDIQQHAVSRPGDVWQLGPHRLLCGSSLEGASFERLMAGARATMVFADAPYNVPVDGHVSGLGKTKHREFAMASGEMSPEQFTTFLATNLGLVAAHLVDGAVLALCMDWRGLMALQTAMAQVDLTLINLAVWAKTNAGMGKGKTNCQWQRRPIINRAGRSGGRSAGDRRGRPAVRARSSSLTYRAGSRQPARCGSHPAARAW